jgi:hypothetical protein
MMLMASDDGTASAAFSVGGNIATLVGFRSAAFCYSVSA